MTSLTSLTSLLIADYNSQIALFNSVPSCDFSKIVVAYYTSLKNLVVYVSNNLDEINKDRVVDLKNNIVNRLHQLLDNASNQTSGIYLEVSKITQEDYENVSMLCDAIEKICT